MNRHSDSESVIHAEIAASFQRLCESVGILLRMNECGGAACAVIIVT